MVPVEFQNPLFEKIDNSYYILVTPQEITIKTICKETKYMKLLGTHLIHLPGSCQMEVNNEHYGNNETTCPGYPIILPQILETNQIFVPTTRPLLLENISLDEIHYLQRHMKIVRQDLEKEQPISSYITHFS